MRKPNRDKQMRMEEPKFVFKPSFYPYQHLTSPLYRPSSTPHSQPNLRCRLVLQPLNPVQDPKPAADKPPLVSRSATAILTSAMPRNGNNPSLADTYGSETPNLLQTPKDTTSPPLIWDWDVEHDDRKRERRADSDATLRGAAPFEVDRRVLKDVVREKVGVDVGRINFLSAGMSRLVLDMRV